MDTDLLWPPLPGKAIKLFSSTSPNALFSNSVWHWCTEAGFSINSGAQLHLYHHGDACLPPGEGWSPNPELPSSQNNQTLCLKHFGLWQLPHQAFPHQKSDFSVLDLPASQHSALAPTVPPVHAPPPQGCSWQSWQPTINQIKILRRRKNYHSESSPEPEPGIPLWWLLGQGHLEEVKLGLRKPTVWVVTSSRTSSTQVPSGISNEVVFLFIYFFNVLLKKKTLRGGTWNEKATHFKFA